jgi:hypothetical protein
MKIKDKEENKKKNREGKKPEQPENFDNSTTYRKDPKTGKWIIKIPAGSTVYNYLYRDPNEWETD